MSDDMTAQTARDILESEAKDRVAAAEKAIGDILDAHMCALGVQIVVDGSGCIKGVPVISPRNV